MGADFARAIVTHGDRANPPIVFLHGVRLGGKIWAPHAKLLCEEFFVVTPDLPGHGALDDLPFDAPTIEAFLAYLCDSVVAHPPLFVGYSLGGYVAMRCATDMPDRTSGLLLTGSTTDIVGARRALYKSAVRISGFIPPAVLQKLLTGFFRLTLPPRVAEVVIPFRFNHDVFEQSLGLVGGIRYSEALKSYEKPVQIVNGKWDVLFRRDERRYAAAAGAQVIVMPACDHVAPLREPERFSGIVRRFAREVFRRPGTTAQGRTAQSTAG